MMSRWKKILIGAVALMFVIVAALFLLVKTYLTPERVRETLVPIVEASLQRNLSLGDIEISLFSGIVVNDLVLTERETGALFVSVDQAVLRYRVWPLLLMKIEVDELRLERPNFQLIRFRDGTFNFNGPQETAVETNAAGEGESSTVGSSPLGISISEITVRDGTLTYLDQSSVKEEQHVFSSLDLQVKDFSLAESFQTSLTTIWNNNELTINGEFDLDDLSVNVTAGLNKIQAKIQGDLLADVKGDRLRAVLKLLSTPASELSASIPNELMALPDTSGLSGQITAEITLDGLVSDPGNLLKSGRIDLDAIAATTQFTHNSLNGSIRLERKSLKTENLTLSINDQKLDVAVGIEDITRQPVKVDVAIVSSRIDLDRFIPAEKNEAQVEKEGQVGSVTAAKAQPAEEIGPYELPLELRGTIEIEELLYHGLMMQKFAVGLGIKNNILTIERLTSNVAEGQLEQTGQVDLGVRGLRYSNKSNLKNVQVNPVVKALKPEYAKSIYGVVSGQITMSGAGMVETTLKKNLKGSGAFVLTQSKLTRMPALDSAAALLNMPELKEIIIDNGQIAFQVEKEMVSIDLNLKGPMLKQSTVGTVSLDGQLRLNALLSLSPPLSQKLDKKGLLRNALVGKDGWSRVPLLVKGNHVDPIVQLDMQQLKKQATQGAIDSLANRLLKKAGGNKETENTQKEDQTRKLIDGALKGLFGN